MVGGESSAAAGVRRRGCQPGVRWNAGAAARRGPGPGPHEVTDSFQLYLSPPPLLFFVCMCPLLARFESGLAVMMECVGGE